MKRSPKSRIRQPEPQLMNCQDHLYRNADPALVSRRWFLERCGVGLGAMALSQLLSEGGYAAPTPTTHSLDPLAPRLPHFAPKAKRVIFLFMAGGARPPEVFHNHTARSELGG